MVALVVFVLRRRFWEKAWQSVLAAVAVALPWFAFSWVVLGSAVPDTVIIKTLQKSWGQWDFGNGPGLYAEVFPWATVASFLPVALALAAFALCLVDAARGGPVWARVRPFAPLVPAGIAHYLAYTRLHVPPYHWYYGPSLVAATLFLAAAAAAAVRVPSRVAAAAAVAGVLVISVGGYASGGLPRRFAPLMSNHDATADYERIGPELGRLVGGGTVRSGGEIGVLAYSCGCAIVDLFDDRGAVGPAIAERKARLGALGRAAVDLNFRFFDFGVRPIVTDFALVRGDPPPGALAQVDADVAVGRHPAAVSRPGQRKRSLKHDRPHRSARPVRGSGADRQQGPLRRDPPRFGDPGPGLAPAGPGHEGVGQHVLRPVPGQLLAALDDGDRGVGRGRRHRHRSAVDGRLRRRG